VELVGPGGLLTGLTKPVLETAVEAEMSENLGYDKHDPAGRNRANSRNGIRTKTVLTEVGPVDIEVPLDRDGSFEPAGRPVRLHGGRRRDDRPDVRRLALLREPRRPVLHLRGRGRPWSAPLTEAVGAVGQPAAVTDATEVTWLDATVQANLVRRRGARSQESPPVGVQFAAGYGREDLLVQLAVRS